MCTRVPAIESDLASREWKQFAIGKDPLAIDGAMQQALVVLIGHLNLIAPARFDASGRRDQHVSVMPRQFCQCSVLGAYLKKIAVTKPIVMAAASRTVSDN